MRLIKITKLNLGSTLLTESKTLLSSVLGKIDIDKIKPAEEVFVDVEKIVAISEIVSTGVSEDSREPKECVKLYFGKDDYWTIAPDENYENLKKHLGIQ